METKFSGQKKGRMTKTKPTSKVDKPSKDGALPTDSNESTMSLTPNKTELCSPELPEKRDDNLSDTASVEQAMTSRKTPSTTNSRRSFKAKSLSRVSILSKGDKASLPRDPEVNTEMDDEKSITGSVQGSGRIRRTEPERFLYFRNQPECGELEPHRVLCTRCDSFVNLGQKQKYNVRPWELHRAKCDAQVRNSSHASRKDEPEMIDTESTATPSVVERRPRRTVAERQAFLEADARTEEVQPEQVKCRGCQNWVRLSTKRQYDLQRWYRHQDYCKATTVSSRVAAAERKLRLVNDAQALSFDTRYVDCSQCGRKIVLEDDGDYNLSKWDEHKAGCPGQLESTMITTEVLDSPKIMPDVVNSVPFPKEDVHVHSDENDSSLAPYAYKNLKRARSSSGALVDGEDDRPTNRPRKESLVASGFGLPSTLEWMLLPLKSFVRGFRESLRGDTQPST